MQISSIVAKLFLVSVLTLAVGLGLTTYTLPNASTGSYPSVGELISRALGDSQPILPGPTPALHLLPQGPKLDSGSHGSLPAVPDSGQPVEWVRAAARRDSAALRLWLLPGVLAFATVERGEVKTVLWRVVLRGDCPLFSRLDALSTGGRDDHLLHLSGNCPRLP